MTILFIFALTYIIYFNTLKCGLIIDDISHQRQIQLGIFHWVNFKSKAKAFSKLQFLFKKCILSRLYGGGTFAYSKPCPECKGQDTYQNKQPCKNCDAYGNKWICNIKHDRYFSIFLNGLTASLIYLAFGQNTISLTASILWLINPINNQVTIWFNGRRYLFNIIIVMCMLMLGVKGLFLYALTPYLQVSAIFAPVLYGWWGIGITAVAIFLFRYKIAKIIGVRMAAIADKSRLKFTPKRLLFIAKFYGNYFFRMVHPKTTLMIYPGFYYYYGVTKEGDTIAHKIITLDTLKGLAAIIITIAGLCIFKGTLFFMWLFMSISILQWCAIIPITQELADRYASLPNVFAMFFLSHSLHSYLGAYSWVPLSFLAGYYITQLNVTFKMYKNIDHYWNYQDFFAPEIPRPRIFKTNWLIQRQEISDAWTEVKRGLYYYPKDYTMLKYAAICSNSVGLFEQAKDFIRQCRNNYYIGTELNSSIEMDKLESIVDQSENALKVQENEYKKSIRTPGAFGNNGNKVKV